MMSDAYSPSLMGVEGSGETQAFHDPKGHVTLSQEEQKSSNQVKESESMSNESPSSLVEENTEGAQTPQLINGANSQFKFKNKEKEEDEDEKIGFIPSPKPICPGSVTKGSILEKRRNFERKNNKNDKLDVKETTKNDKNTRQSK